MRTLVPALLLTSLAGSAFGQVLLPNAYRYSIPDFDQRRQGLANSGNNHCVPTSHSNLLAYIAAHGFPLMFPNVTVPSAPGEYSDITTNIFNLGTLMSTSGTNGTNGAGTQAGMASWIGPFWPLFTVNYQSGPSVSPADCYWDTQAGGLVAFCYGRWELIPANGRYERTGGGHCISLKGVENFWFPNFPAGQYPTLAYRDPAADEGNVPTRLTKQSPFATTKYQCRPYVNNFKGYGITAMWEMQTNSGDQYRRMLDGYTAIFPNFVMTPEATGVSLAAGFHLLDSSPQMHLSLPNIIDLGFCTKPTDVMVITQPATGGPATLHRASIPANQATHSLLLGGAGGLIAPGRRGEVYVFNNNQLRCLKPTMNNAFIDDVTPVAITGNVWAMCYDDLRDGPVLLMDNAQLREYPRRLDSAPTNRSFVIGISYMSSFRKIVPGAVPSEYWLGPLEGNVLRKFNVATDGSGRLALTDTVNPGVTGLINDFSMGSSGHLFLLRGTTLEEWYKPSSTAPWATFPSSVFTGMQIPGGKFHFSRSRTDYDPLIHNTPDWNTEVDTLGGDPPTNSTADCVADVGRQGGEAEPDGHNDNNDFVVFIQFFFTSDPRADIGSQGGIPGADLLFDNNDFVVFIDQFFLCGQ